MKCEAENCNSLSTFDIKTRGLYHQLCLSHLLIWKSGIRFKVKHANPKGFSMACFLFDYPELMWNIKKSYDHQTILKTKKGRTIK